MPDDLKKLGEDFEKLLDRIVDNVMMVRLGAKGIAIIRKRTLEGEFLAGSSANAGQYSTTEMPLPLGKLQKVLQRKLTRQETESGEYRIFTSRSGNRWIVIKGGYKRYRQLAGKFTDHVVMSWSGRMLRNLGIVRSGEREVELDFPDPTAKQLALYHNVEGAGKSRRKHVFMGFTDEELADLTNLANQEIAKKLVKLK